MQKPAHEAKEHTRRTPRNEEYESALREFVAATLADPEFLFDVEILSRRWSNPAA